MPTFKTLWFPSGARGFLKPSKNKHVVTKHIRLLFFLKNNTLINSFLGIKIKKNEKRLANIVLKF